jgi:hypothetical protein
MTVCMKKIFDALGSRRKPAKTWNKALLPVGAEDSEESCKILESKPGSRCISPAQRYEYGDHDERKQYPSRWQIYPLETFGILF